MSYSLIPNKCEIPDVQIWDVMRTMSAEKHVALKEAKELERKFEGKVTA